MAKRSGRKSKDKKLKAQKFHQDKAKEKQIAKEQSIRVKLKLPKNADIPTAGKILFKNVANNAYVLSFNFYNHDCCELFKILRNGQSKSLIMSLDKMSKTTPKKKQQIVKETIYERSVNNDKKFFDYRKFFKELPLGQDSIDEYSFSGQGRIFFFTTESPEKNFINIVSINPFHLNVDN